MKRLLVVSNRLPVSVVKRKNVLHFLPSVGGLATGLSSLPNQFYDITWIGWPGIAREKISPHEVNKIKKHLGESNSHPVFLTQSDLDNFYSGFCNNTIWPLFHYFTQYVVYNNNWWKAYNQVNKKFCDAVLKIMERDDVVWIHDYHLMLLPNMLREKCTDATIGFFLHIPFPSFEVFRSLPWRKEILEGLLGSGLIGFHIYDYVAHFLDSVRGRLGYEYSFGQFLIGGRIVKADSFPMGINYNKYAQSVHDPGVHKEIVKNRKKLGNLKIILSVDRLDYTKGIIQRLHAYDLFLSKYPEYKEKVKLILVAVPSRTKVVHYLQLKRELDEQIGRINGKYGTIGWMPIWYLYTFLTFRALTALYNLSDVALVTPERDGMNLIAKEFVATKENGEGVLILSELAGAANELSEALIVNPHNAERVAEAIHRALTMPKEEQIKRNRTMQNRLQRYTVEKWTDEFIKCLFSVKVYEQDLSAQKLTPRIAGKIQRRYLTSRRRLFVLDYDGTLTPIESKPELAAPDKEILTLLKRLSTDKRNEILIVSGRDKDILDGWFGSLDIALSAEHGVWIKKKCSNWELTESVTNNWIEEIRPLLEGYMDRTPGSFIEEKEYSLAWHYRKSNPELAMIRAGELQRAILHLTTNLGINVLEGHKVIEIKNAGIHKGLAVLRFMSKEKFSFILAAGDDRTDEDIFQALPGHAYSIKVGLAPSKAKYKVDSVNELRILLKEILEGSHV